MTDNALQPLLKEGIPHGSRNFPAAFYHREIPADFKDLPAHWHEELELTLLRAGRLHYIIGSESFEATQGDILLICPDILHSAHALPDETAVTDTCVLHLNLAGLGSDDLCTRRYIVPLQNGGAERRTVYRAGDACYPALRAAFESLWDCRRTELPLRELIFKKALFSFLTALWADRGMDAAPIRELSGTANTDVLKTVLLYIRDHYREPLTITQLAALSGFSQVHFMNIFKNAVGTSCIEYIIEYRLAAAAVQLVNTDRPITRIAMDNGFQSPSYFNRVFKKKYCLTPSDYRRRKAVSDKTE